MEQKFLWDFEKRCVEEEAPFCQAACPFHVDGRAFSQAVAKADWAQAVKHLSNRPLPYLMGWICDGPCAKACRREENLGGGVSIHLLERLALQEGPKLKKPFKLPTKRKNVYIFGASLAALAAAWELLRKGFEVFLNPVGEALFWDVLSLAPKEVIDIELESLKNFGLKIDEKFSFNDIQQLVELGHGIFWTLKSFDSKPINPISLEHSQGIFLFNDANATTSRKAEAGKKASISLERYFQNASLTSTREKEGSYKSRLFTNLKNFSFLEKLAPDKKDGGYGIATGQSEAARCLDCHCLECVKECAYLENFKFYPKKYAKEIYNNLAMVHGIRTAGSLIYGCTLCGQCEKVCPENFSMSDFSRAARQEMAERGFLAKSLHEYALNDFDMAISNFSSFFKPALGEDKSPVYYFPGCQLGAGNPGQAFASYKYLQQNLGNVGIWIYCCGAAWDWLEKNNEVEKHWNIIKDSWQKAGCPKIITACSSCQKMFNKYAPEISVESIWETFLTIGLPENAKGSGCFSLHDPCSCQSKPEIRNAARKLAEKLGLEIKEFVKTQELSNCCGFGGLAEGAEPKIASLIAKKRVDEAENNILTYCPMCWERFGGETAYLMDFIFPDFVATHPTPSQRIDNRAKLKEKFNKLYSEKIPIDYPPWYNLSLQLNPEVENVINERRILLGDIKETLYHAQNNDQLFQKPGSDRFLAFYKPKYVTFWVEFSKQEQSVVVHRAWSHRMDVKAKEAI